MPQDITLLPIGDTHIGGTTAIHPMFRKDAHGIYRSLSELGGWRYTDRPNFYPSSLQVRIGNHFEKSLDAAAEQRKNTLLFLLLMGDLEDGYHHHTSQLVTTHITEQSETVEEFIEYIQHRLGFTRGDTLAFLYGTEVHVGIEEEKIAKNLNAYQYPDGTYCAHFLEMELNGVLIWAYHKGVSAGQGMTRGNACIAKMKQVYYQCLQTGKPIPSLIISSHTHDQYHAVWMRPDGVEMHYVITAPWQDKTRFAFDNLATNRNAVGMQTITITGDSRIIVNPPMLMASPLGHTIKL